MAGELHVNCPFCVRAGKTPDYKRHLHINTAKNLAHCFRCGFGSRKAKEALATYGIHVEHRGTSSSSTAPRYPNFPPEIRDDWADPAALPARHYLATRTIGLPTIYHFDLRYALLGPYADRIILPIYENDLLVSFQARDFTGKNPIKYLGPPGRRRDVLFNIDAARTAGCILLVEGIFDAIAVPVFGVAMLGKQLTPEQISRLTQPPRVPIVICTDADAQAEGETIANQLPSLFGLVHHATVHNAKDLGAASSTERHRLHTLCTTVKETYGPLIAGTA